MKLMINIWNALYKEYADEYREINNEKELISEAKKALYSFIMLEMKDFGETKPPLLERKIQSPYIRYGRRIKKIEFINITNDAYLLPEKGGFEIFIKESLNYYRQRLCLAHEIAHTYFYKFYDNVPMHIANSSKRYFQANWGLDEGFTYEIAREILLPRFILHKFLKNKNITLNGMIKLQKIFKVPISIVAKRLIQDLHYINNSCFIITRYTSNKKNIIIKEPKSYTIYKSYDFKDVSISKNWKTIKNIIVNNFDDNGKDLQIKKTYLPLNNHSFYMEFVKDRGSIFIYINNKNKFINTQLIDFLH